MVEQDVFHVSMWSIFDIIDGSKVNTFRLNYWEWSNASCDNLCLVFGEFYGENWMGRFNEHQIWSKQVSDIPIKNLFLVFLHFICFQNVSSFSSLQKFYNNPFLRTLKGIHVRLQFCAIFRKICLECVLSYLIWVVYIFI